MIVDFQHHYTPPELMERGGAGILRLDQHGNPNYKFNPLLADLPAHIRMMDRAGIDLAVLSCGSGFDQPDLAICRLINDRMRQAERDYPGRFIGLAHVPALDTQAGPAELKRCAVELRFPGVVIASELQGQPLDAEALRPFWKACADLELYIFIHPLPRVIAWPQMYADEEAVCRDCGKKHAPHVVALVDLAHVADRVGKVCRHALVPPMEALLALARAAEDFNHHTPRLLRKTPQLLKKAG